jgi:hypothetical protein
LDEVVNYLGVTLTLCLGLYILMEFQSVDEDCDVDRQCALVGDVVESLYLENV